MMRKDTSNNQEQHQNKETWRHTERGDVRHTHEGFVGKPDLVKSDKIVHTLPGSHLQQVCANSTHQPTPTKG